MKKRGVVGRIFSVIGYVLVAVLLGAIAFVMISKASGKLVFLFGRATVWVISESMEPAIPKSSYILVEKTSPEKIEVGDVIIFISDDPSIAGKYNTHRVVEIIGDHEEFVTKGDNNLVEDAYHARAEAVAGKYVKNLEFLSTLGRFLATRTGLISSISLVLSLTLLMFMPEMKRLRRKQDEELEKKHEEDIDALVALEVEKLKKQHEAEANKSAEDPEG